MNLLPASPAGGGRRRLGRLLVVAVALAIVVGLANQGLFYPGEGHGTPLAPSLAMAAAGGKPEAWGNNNFGQIGDGTHDNRDWPQNVAVLGPDALQVAGGYYHSLALMSDGTVWGWGSDSDGQLGLPPSAAPQCNTTIGIVNCTNLPKQVQGISGVAQIAAGGFHSLALKPDGTVWAWGRNYDGQLGTGMTTDTFNTTSVSSPAPVRGLDHVVEVAAGARHSLALRSDGTVWAWGDNSYGQLGAATNTLCHSTDGDFPCNPVPVQVQLAGSFTHVAGGGAHSLALRSDGTVWAWGDNHSGQLGNGTTAAVAQPQQVGGLPYAVRIAAGGAHSLALSSNGAVYAWGDNHDGQLGIGLPCFPVSPTSAPTTPCGSSSPVQVRAQGGAVQAIAAGGAQSLALRSDGKVLAWGGNALRQLGVGQTGANRNQPVQACGLTDISAIAAGGEHSLAISPKTPRTQTPTATPGSPTPTGTPDVNQDNSDTGNANDNGRSGSGNGNGNQGTSANNTNANDNSVIVPLHPEPGCPPATPTPLPG